MENFHHAVKMYLTARKLESLPYPSSITAIPLLFSGLMVKMMSAAAHLNLIYQVKSVQPARPNCVWSLNKVTIYQSM